MELKEFLEHVNRRELLNTPEIYEFMNRMSDTARRITCRINGEYHTPELLHRLRPQHTCRPQRLHQRRVPFSGSGRRHDRRRLPDRACRGLCDSEPQHEPCGACGHDARADSSGPERMGRLQLDHIAGSHDRRQCGDCGGCGGYEGRGAGYHRRGRAGTLYPPYLTV